MAGTTHFIFEVLELKFTFIDIKNTVLAALKIFRKEAWENVTEIGLMSVSVQRRSIVTF
jgi:hypothetical protein